MKLVCVSDTHNEYDYKDMPKGDVFIHAGDLTYDGTLQETTKELGLISKLDYRYKIVVPGNHDFLFEKDLTLVKSLCKDNIYILIDDVLYIDGICFYGMPWVPGLPRWAFSNRRVDWPMKLRNVSDDTNVLITHAPAWMCRDYVRPCVSRNGEGIHLGSKKLLDRINELKKLKAHIFGHIHDSYGMIKEYGVYRINAAICDESYRPVNKPIEVEINA